ncbi:MAG: DUF4139 domain-containing protein, partial [Chlorobi bacterium]|nr:DUF4139 domain-containing protein [Chlorobiota bacterium]
SGKQDVGISYQTGSMGWHTEYVAVLNESDTRADIKAWVSINNNSGATYENAKLKLVAGEVNRAVNVREYLNTPLISGDRVYPVANQFQEKEFFAYHIYNLQRKTTLRNNETKQISLFEAEDVKIKKKFKHIGNSENVSVYVEFKNSKKNNLGMPMPAGKVRFNKSDGDNLEFIGEDMITHTPKDEKIELKLGDAFDIKAEYKIMGQKNLSNKVSIKKVEIKFKNHSKKDVVIEAERYFYGDWEISKNNFDFEKKDYQTAIFKVKVDKDEEVVLKYTVRIVTP